MLGLGAMELRCWGYIGYWVYIGRMEKKMETSIVYRGYIGVMGLGFRLRL